MEYSLPTGAFMNSLSSGPKLNVSKNILAGPLAGQYWNHSPGLEYPLTREEGPFPLSGNIGSLIKQEANNNFSNCSSTLPLVSGSPSCTASQAFVPDFFTKYDNCGEECELKYPEAFGDQNFGMIKNESGNYILTNSHGLHAYENVRAATENTGPSSSYGCYEFIPRLSETSGNSCMLNQYPAYQQVGDWMKLPENQDLVNYQFKWN